jgi:transcriptional regulator with PAS, ATPase and Fis domain
MLKNCSFVYQLKMTAMDYMKELNVAITVCDKEGKILQMNDKSQKTNHGDLVGQNVLDCHPEPARTKLVRLMEEHATNAYTIEKNGVKKLIYQTPWYENGEFMGLVEFSLEIPFEMPHYIRKPKAE